MVTKNIWLATLLAGLLVAFPQRSVADDFFDEPECDEEFEDCEEESVDFGVAIANMIAQKVLDDLTCPEDSDEMESFEQNLERSTNREVKRWRLSSTLVKAFLRRLGTQTNEVKNNVREKMEQYIEYCSEGFDDDDSEFPGDDDPEFDPGEDFPFSR